MTDLNLADELAALPLNDDFAARAAALCDAWAERGVGIDAVEPVLRFIEDHPSLDYGSPGPLTHFVERFHGGGYDSLLITSVKRRPTMQTVWMLNRVLNGAPAEARPALEAVLDEVRTRKDTTSDVKALADRFWERAQTD